MSAAGTAGGPSGPPSWSEVIAVNAARLLQNGTVCFVGIGMPSTAALLAQRTHAPGCVLIYESGAIGARPSRLPLSIGDGELADTAQLVVSMPEVFNYWLQGGRVDVGFLGAAQVDRSGNLNTTVIGPYESPRVRLPGAGGAPEIATSAGRVVVLARHDPRTLVERVDFLTTSTRPQPAHAAPAAERGRRQPTLVITDLAVLRLDDSAGELVLDALHPGTSDAQVIAATGWPLRHSDRLTVTEPPTQGELDALRALTASSRG